MTGELVNPQLVAWSPPIDLLLIALATCIAIAGTTLAVRRAPAPLRLLPHTLRLLAIIALLAILLNPLLPAPATSADRPLLTVLIDTSRSMSIEDGQVDGRPASRLDALRSQWLADSALDRLGMAADVHLLTFSDSAATIVASQAQSVAADGNATRLTEAVEAALTALHRAETDGADGAPPFPHRLLILSDALDTTGSDMGAIAQLARRSRARIDFVMPTPRAGSTAPADVALTATTGASLAPLGAAVPIDVTIAQVGFNGQEVRLTLRQTAPIEMLLAERMVTLGAVQRIAVDVTPQLSHGAAESERGLHSVECVATIEPLAGELDTANNSQDFFLQLSNARVRVALFEGEPSWDSRFFVAALADDPRFELTVTHAIGRRPGATGGGETIRTRRITPGVAESTEVTGVAPPLTQSELDAFDVIALGRRVETLFPGRDAARLTRFVTVRGGALVFLRADPITGTDEPMAAAARAAMVPILPLRFAGGATSASPLFTLPQGASALGAVASAIEEAPEVGAIAHVTDVSPLATVWLAGVDAAHNETVPALLHSPVANGHVLINLAQDIWRWQMLPPDRLGWRPALGAFWPQVITSLALGAEWSQGQDVSLAADRVAAAPGERVTVVVRARGPIASVLKPEVLVQGAEGESPKRLTLTPTPTQPGKWLGSFTPEGPGVTTITLPAFGPGQGDIMTKVSVRERTGEMSRTVPDAVAAATLTRATGGEVLGPTDVDRYLRFIEQDQLATRSQVILQPAWREAWLFCFIVGALGFEWFWRRRNGLP